ncbi:MAG: hypothetical protein WCI31_05985 [Prolixibacteraceae bacterium]
MKKLLLLSVLFASILCSRSYAQIVQKESEVEDKSYLEAGIDFNSNNNVYGIFENFNSQANTSVFLSYFGEKGLMLSVNGMWLKNSNNSASSNNSTEVDLTGGWNFEMLNKRITITPSYSHFLYSAAASSAKTLFTDQAGVEFSGSFKWFTPSFTADYLFGKNSAHNFNLTLGFEVDFDDVITNGSLLQLLPSLGANYGDLSYSIFFTNKLFQFLSPLRTKYGDNITISQLQTNGALPKAKGLNNQLSYLNPSATLGQIFETTNSSRINSFDLTLPLVYSKKNLSLSTSLNIVLPRNVPAYIQSKTVLFFSAGVTYSFELQK